jgi:hypothetical protein
VDISKDVFGKVEPSRRTRLLEWIHARGAEPATGPVAAALPASPSTRGEPQQGRRDGRLARPANRTGRAGRLATDQRHGPQGDLVVLAAGRPGHGGRTGDPPVTTRADPAAGIGGADGGRRPRRMPRSGRQAS